jgi:gamma-glutamyltranspeptidase
VLQIENRVSSDVINQLKAKGHEVSELPAWGHSSSSQLMEVLSQGTFAFGSDPRSEGHAAGI